MNIKKDNSTLTIVAAIDGGLELIENPKWYEKQRKARNAGLDRFLREKQPKLKLWRQLLPGHVHEFAVYMDLERKLSPFTANNYFNVLRLASKYVRLYHPKVWKDIFPGMTRKSKKIRNESFIMPDQLAKAIETSRIMNEPAVTAGLAFGGLAGLGISELCDLTSDDIGPNTINVRRAKNEYRARVIPICDALQPFAQAWKLTNRTMAIRSETALSTRARKVLDATAIETGDETFEKITLHDATRVTFANMAKQSGASDSSIAAYLGHSHQTTLGEHYLRLIPRENDLPRIKQAKLDQLSADVCAKINKKVNKIQFFS